MILHRAYYTIKPMLLGRPSPCLKALVGELQAAGLFQGVAD